MKDILEKITEFLGNYWEIITCFILVILLVLAIILTFSYCESTKYLKKHLEREKIVKQKVKLPRDSKGRFTKRS